MVLYSNSSVYYRQGHEFTRQDSRELTLASSAADFVACIFPGNV